MPPVPFWPVTCAGVGADRARGQAGLRPLTLNSHSDQPLAFSNFRWRRVYSLVANPKFKARSTGGLSQPQRDPQ